MTSNEKRLIVWATSLGPQGVAQETRQRIETGEFEFRSYQGRQEEDATDAIGELLQFRAEKTTATITNVCMRSNHQETEGFTESRLAFDANIEEISKSQQIGRYVVFFKTEFLGAFPNYSEALDAGYNTGNTSFYVGQIEYSHAHPWIRQAIIETCDTIADEIHALLEQNSDDAKIKRWADIIDIGGPTELEPQVRKLLQTAMEKTNPMIGPLARAAKRFLIRKEDQVIWETLLKNPDTAALAGRAMSLSHED